MTFEEAYNEAHGEVDKQLYDVKKKLKVLIKNFGSNKAEWYLYLLLDYELILEIVVEIKRTNSSKYPQVIKAFHRLQETLASG